MTTTSPLTSGWPSSSRATPGASWITRKSSSLTMLSISDVAPPRLTMALRGEPESTSVSWNPLAMESIATKTPTTPAIPRTATRLDAHRSLTLRML